MMDLLSSGDVAVRHIVAFNTVNIKHTIEVSDSVVSLTEVVGKYLVICATIGGVFGLARSYFQYSTRSKN